MQYLKVTFVIVLGPSNEDRLTRKHFPSGNEQNTENNSRIGLSNVPSEELIVVGDDNVCSVQIMADKDIYEFSQSSSSIIDADCDDENEMNDEVPVSTSSEMRKIEKNIFSYLDVHSNSETNYIMVDIE
ncbi:hypothetical protein TNCV_739481 [Trichonephila clavipes]|nr:hypothetical protein TNCV_739481 [Trichonephila clavipes]